MLTIGITLLRYLFLFFLLLSIYKLVRWMIADLRATSSQQNREKRSVRREETPPTLAPKTPAELVVAKSSVAELKEGHAFGFDRESLIGRDEHSNIVVPASFASARHARLYFKEGQYWLEDLHSTNGTFLNEVQVRQPIVLANRDKIRIGDVIFEFVRWGYEVGADD